jgi:hypothetical protein
MSTQPSDLVQALNSSRTADEARRKLRQLGSESVLTILQGERVEYSKYKRIVIAVASYTAIASISEVVCYAHGVLNSHAVLLTASVIAIMPQLLMVSLFSKITANITSYRQAILEMRGFSVANTILMWLADDDTRLIDFDKSAALRSAWTAIDANLSYISADPDALSPSGKKGLFRYTRALSRSPKGLLEAWQISLLERITPVVQTIFGDELASQIRRS